MTAAPDIAFVPPAELPAHVRAGMFALCSRWYTNYGEDYFFEELDRCDHCILLTDSESGAFVGFGSIRLLQFEVEGTPVGAFHTGHAFVERDYWGSNEPTRSMFVYMMDRVRQAPERAWFWHYNATGYRAYRYMPALFHRFTPDPGTPRDPLAHAVRTALGRQFFAHYYDPETGLVDWQWEGYGLSPIAQELTAAKASKDALLSFQAVNPRWAEGVELLCQARLDPDNLTRLANHWAERGHRPAAGQRPCPAPAPSNIYEASL